MHGKRSAKYDKTFWLRRIYMAIQWTPNLSVGVKHIDDQHKLLFEKADKLFQAGMENKAKDYIGQMLDFLDDYTKKHFSDEEAYMLKIGYPELEAQKKAHTYFINELAKLKDEYKNSGGNIVVIINANKLVVNWLIQHISGMDKKIGDFVKTLN
jgi:hemerythrin